MRHLEHGVVVAGDPAPLVAELLAPDVPEILELLEQAVHAVAAEVAAAAEVRHPDLPVVGLGEEVAEEPARGPAQALVLERAAVDDDVGVAPVLDADDAGHPLPHPALLGLGRPAGPAPGWLRDRRSAT